MAKNHREYIYVPRTTLFANRHVPERFEEGDPKLFTQSIKEHGIINPLAVRKLSTSHYIIIDGRRRWTAINEIHQKHPEQRRRFVQVPVRLLQATSVIQELRFYLALNYENLKAHDLAALKDSFIAQGVAPDDLPDAIGGPGDSFIPSTHSFDDPRHGLLHVGKAIPAPGVQRLDDCSTPIPTSAALLMARIQLESCEGKKQPHLCELVRQFVLLKDFANGRISRKLLLDKMRGASAPEA